MYDRLNYLLYYSTQQSWEKIAGRLDTIYCKYPQLTTESDMGHGIVQ